MKKKFFSGDSVRQAVLQAARFFEIEPEAVAYREVDRRHGFLRGRRRAVIEVDPESPARPAGELAEPSDANGGPPAIASPEPEPALAPEPGPEPMARRHSEREPEPEAADVPLGDRPTEEMPVHIFDPDPTEGGVEEPAPVSEASPEPGPFEPLSAAPTPAVRRYPRAESDVADAAREALERLFDLAELELEAEVLQGEERLEIELSGEDEEFLLEDRGRLLLAIQHLLPRMLRGLTGKSTPCWVDCDNFHEIRTEQLRDLAQRVATEVRNNRRSRTLEPMSPDERRIVHLTLADDPAVETVSQGNGLFKRVQVRPLKTRPRGF